VNVGVLASGAGTNLQALLDSVHGREAQVVAVASDRADAVALERARARNIATGVFPRDDFPDREARDTAIAEWLHSRDVQLVVLAGYMALLTPAFLGRFPQRVINVHPSLLPAFPGIAAIAQAIDYGAKVTGVTVHFVDEGVDTGPIVLQEAIDLSYPARIAEIEDRVHGVEHRLLPRAVRLIAAGRVRPDPANPQAMLIDDDD
jgi:phosphoribosylglycinamide formyltransferase 1